MLKGQESQVYNLDILFSYFHIFYISRGPWTGAMALSQGGCPQLPNLRHTVPVRENSLNYNKLINFGQWVHLIIIITHWSRWCSTNGETPRGLCWLVDTCSLPVWREGWRLCTWICPGMIVLPRTLPGALVNLPPCPTGTGCICLGQCMLSSTVQPRTPFPTDSTVPWNSTWSRILVDAGGLEGPDALLKNHVFWATMCGSG